MRARVCGCLHATCSESSPPDSTRIVTSIDYSWRRVDWWQRRRRSIEWRLPRHSRLCHLVRYVLCFPPILPPAWILLIPLVSFTWSHFFPIYQSRQPLARHRGNSFRFIALDFTRQWKTLLQAQYSVATLKIVSFKRSSIPSTSTRETLQIDLVCSRWHFSWTNKSIINVAVNKIDDLDNYHVDHSLQESSSIHNHDQHRFPVYFLSRSLQCIHRRVMEMEKGYGGEDKGHTWHSNYEVFAYCI